MKVALVSTAFVLIIDGLVTLTERRLLRWQPATSRQE